MSFNWLDIVLGSILLISAVSAIRNGLSKEVIRLIALIAGIVGGMWWYREAGAYLQPLIADERIASFCGFLLILFGTLIAGALIAWTLGKVLGWVGLRWFDRLLGGAFGVARGGLICAAVVLALLAFTPMTRSAEVVAGSTLAPLVLHASQAAIYVAPREVREAYDKNFAKVKAVWIEEITGPSLPAAAGAAMTVVKESPLRATAQ